MVGYLSTGFTGSGVTVCALGASAEQPEPSGGIFTGTETTRSTHRRYQHVHGCI